MTIPWQIDHATAPDAIACRNAPAPNAILTLADPVKRAPKDLANCFTEQKLYATVIQSKILNIPRIREISRLGQNSNTCD
jgi:hypothetical protein